MGDQASSYDTVVKRFRKEWENIEGQPGLVTDTTCENIEEVLIMILFLLLMKYKWYNSRHHSTNYF